MKQSKVKSCCLARFQAYPLEVEVSLSSGLPYYQVVGLGDSAVRESGQRVKMALKSAGFGWPQQRVTVNLSPAWLSKKGTAFDLPIALGILQAAGQIPQDLSLAAWGELSLDGKVKTVPSALCYADALLGGREDVVIQPAEAKAEIAKYHSGGLYASYLRELCGRLCDYARFSFAAPYKKLDPPDISPDAMTDEEAPVIPSGSQEAAWRALTLGLAGGHHVLLRGAAGCGKTSLIRAARRLLPPLEPEERYQQALNYAFMGIPDDDIPKCGEAPFRAPHYSVTAAALLGGSFRYPLGEVSLADKGILFLDEISEYAVPTLNMLRQPAEDHYVLRHRSGKILKIPSRFILFAAANPCPCGRLFEESPPCSCSDLALKRYKAKFENPFFERVDLHVEMLKPDTDKLRSILIDEPIDLSEQRKHLSEVRAFQWKRQGRGKKDMTRLNAWLPSGELRHNLKAPPAVYQAAEKLADQFSMSVRSFHQLLRAARTVADFAFEETLREEHVLEAFTFKKHGEN